jgi:hypothetical protein
VRDRKHFLLLSNLILQLHTAFISSSITTLENSGNVAFVANSSQS